jgi:hypothetical protein
MNPVTAALSLVLVLALCVASAPLADEAATWTTRQMLALAQHR